MLFHIVRMNETINDILKGYNITLDELKKENGHITDFNSITPGIKLKISLLNDDIKQVLEKSEPFIKSYEMNPEIYNIEKIENKPYNSRGIRYVNNPKNLKSPYGRWVLRK